MHRHTNKMKTEGLVVLITGGASGIGKAVTEYLLENGAKYVCILDKDEIAGPRVESELQAKFGKERIKWIHCDVTNEDHLEAAFKTAQEKYKKLDVVINNAGGPVQNLQGCLAVFLGAVIRGTYLAKSLMSKANGGSGGLVINTASIAGVLPIPHAIYSAAKFGVVGFSRSIGEFDPQFRQDNMRIATICPWYIDTPLIGNLVNQTPPVPDCEEHFSQIKFVEMSRVVDAFMKVIEDDSIHGEKGVVRVFPDVTLIDQYTPRSQLRKEFNV